MPECIGRQPSGYRLIIACLSGSHFHEGKDVGKSHDVGEQQHQKHQYRGTKQAATAGRQIIDIFLYSSSQAMSASGNSCLDAMLLAMTKNVNRSKSDREDSRFAIIK
jgi:hypothetical protein